VDKGTKLKRRKHPEPSKWKQNVSMNKRLGGVSYTNKKGHIKGAKQVGPRCTSGYCKKSSLRDCETISEEQREWIFKQFWSMNTWSERRLYITTLVTKVSAYYIIIVL
jgi:hypothetical protein